MTNSLRFKPTPDGLIVRMQGDPPVSVREWTSIADGSAGVGALIRLRDDGGAVEKDDGCSLSVSWPSVAGLTPGELRYIGLPDASPFAIEVVANNAIHDADFQIRYGFLRNGRRVLGTRREGAWLHAGGGDFVLLDPLYSIADAIDLFNRADEADLESRMLRWGRIAEMLPADAVVGDDNLRSLKIVVASSFELDPFVNEDGEPDFDPVVGRRATRATDVGDHEQAFDRTLPEARQQDFARRFRALSGVRHRYPAGGGAFVVLTPEVQQALAIVQRAQSGTPDERRDFLRNASGYLRGAFDTHEFELDSVFSDDGLSDRVSGVGIWVDKTVPWIRHAAEPWLPPDESGLRIGSQMVPLSPDDLSGLLERIQSAVERGEPTVRTDSGADIPANSATISAVEALIRRHQSAQRPRTSTEPDKAPVGRDDDDQILIVIDNLETVRFTRERKRRRPGISTSKPGLRTELLPHQQEGLAWLETRWEAGSWGALLADDMGLGKTLEALAFLSCLKTHSVNEGLPQQPTLVVAPTGLLKNWKDEHAKHLAGEGLGRAVEAHGGELRRLRKKHAADRGDDLAFGQPLLDIALLKDAHWVLTTYETLRDYQHSFGRIHWRAGVFDEAQKIKNPNARLTDAALAMNVDFALLMTGTPVENRPADIWSLLDRTEPGMFGTLKDFSGRYERRDAEGHAILEDLHRTLTKPAESTGPALMLRRLKEDHLATLPEKRVHRRVVEMPPFQAEAYAEIVLRGRQDGGVLQTLQKLRNTSLHPAVPGDRSVDQYIRESARLSETFAILEGVADQGEKVLIFVESLKMQDFLIGALRHRFRLREDVLVINGAVSGGRRKARVDMFQDRMGFDVMLLSPRAGGVGLTLTAANHVIHLSRWWNPAVEDQCTDRVFRIGQRRTVHVYLPLARHPRFGEYSFDLKLDSLMERKRAMNRRVLAPTTATERDVQDLYRSTMTEARGGKVPDAPEVRVDVMERSAFED